MSAGPGDAGPADPGRGRTGEGGRPTARGPSAAGGGERAAVSSNADRSTRRVLALLCARLSWVLVLGGWALAFGVGLAIGFGLMAAGWWAAGAAWERASLAFAYGTVSPWLDPIFLWIPFVGTNYTLVPIVAVAVVLLWRRDYFTTALHLAVVQLGSWTLNPGLKFTIPRPRPEMFDLRGQYAFPAYPSGHSIAVVAVLGTVAYLVHRAGHGSWAYWVVGVFFLINTYSRLYLAVHWPTDMIGGTVVGAIWLAATLRAFVPLHERPPAGRELDRASDG